MDDSEEELRQALGRRTFKHGSTRLMALGAVAWIIGSGIYLGAEDDGYRQFGAAVGLAGIVVAIVGLIATAVRIGTREGRG